MDIFFFYNSRILEGKRRKNIIDNFLYFLYNWDLSALSLALKFFCCNTIPFQSSLSTIKLSFKNKCIVHCERNPMLKTFLLDFHPLCSLNVNKKYFAKKRQKSGLN